MLTLAFFGQASSSHDGSAMFVVLGATAVLIIVPTVFAVQWRKQRESQMAANLLQDMLAQNLSTDEIERVMNIWSKGKMDAEEYTKLTAIESRRKKKPEAIGEKGRHAYLARRPT